MIPFASQRANGQDLAVHLMNEQDNDVVELVDLRGSVSNDLSGAFAEWEFQAKSLTKCKKYLYSLSLNPDPRQGELAREQYLEYFSDVERELNLEGQGRAIVRHIKNGREHYHAVYSRIDAENKRAVPISFDKMKLMRITREFTDRHDLELPQGYEDHQERDQRSQLSLYDKAQEQETGISKSERSAFVTDCWKRRDTPQSFVAELQENGYVLASGRRPYLLVDRFGHINSLPRLINDSSVKLKDVKAFLSKAYPEDELPDAEWVKEQLLQDKTQTKSESATDRREKKERLEALKISQAQRRTGLEKDKNSLKKFQGRDASKLQEAHRQSLAELRADYQLARRKDYRKPLSPEDGLRFKLAKVTGYLAVSKAIRRYQDKRRLEGYLKERSELQDQFQEETTRLRRIHDLQLLEFRRKERSLEAVEKRELKSLETSLRHARNYRLRRGYEHMPTLALTLSPPGRPANIHRAKHRHVHSTKTYERREDVETFSDYFNTIASQEDPHRTSIPPRFEKPKIGKNKKKKR